MVAAMPRRKKRYIRPTPSCAATTSGCRRRSLRVRRRRALSGKQVWATLGTADVLAIEQAREQAREAIKRIKAGLPAFEPPPVQPDTVADVCAGWLKRHVEAKGLRTGDEHAARPRTLRAAATGVTVPSRTSGAATLPLCSTRSRTGTAVDGRQRAGRAALRWRAGSPAATTTYVPPFVKNMRRVPAQARKRSRTLDDAELRAVWQAAEAAGDALVPSSSCCC